MSSSDTKNGLTDEESGSFIQPDVGRIKHGLQLFLAGICAMSLRQIGFRPSFYMSRALGGDAERGRYDMLFDQALCVM